MEASGLEFDHLWVIGMHDGARSGLAAPDRHLQRVDDQLGAQMICDRSADHPAVERVEHHAHVHLAGVSAMFG